MTFSKLHDQTIIMLLPSYGVIIPFFSLFPWLLLRDVFVLCAGMFVCQPTPTTHPRQQNQQQQQLLPANICNSKGAGQVGQSAGAWGGSKRGGADCIGSQSGGAGAGTWQYFITHGQILGTGSKTPWIEGSDMSVLSSYKLPPLFYSHCAGI